MRVALIALTIASLPPMGTAETTSHSDPAKTRPALIWDSTEKVLEPSFGDTSAAFQFTAVNASTTAITIQEIRPTCGCTVAEMPAQPWIIAPGASGTFGGQIDFRAGRGVFSKALFVTSTAGLDRLVVTVKVPGRDPMERKRDQRVAAQDRQAIFRGDCRRCHYEAARGRSAAGLFTAACGVCHLSSDRADLVPDLLTAREPRDASYWRRWIGEGKAGSLMPGWSIQHLGPLTADEVEALVEYCLRTLPTQPRP